MTWDNWAEDLQANGPFYAFSEGGG